MDRQLEIYKRQNPHFAMPEPKKKDFQLQSLINDEIGPSNLFDYFHIKLIIQSVLLYLRIIIFHFVIYNNSPMIDPP